MKFPKRRGGLMSKKTKLFLWTVTEIPSLMALFEKEHLKDGAASL